MLETIKLANGQVFEVRNHGVIQNTVMKTRIFSINSDLGIAEVLSLFQDEDNISSITYSTDDKVRDIFADCVSFKSIHYDEQGYIIELSTDAVEKRVKEMEKKIAQLEAAHEASQVPDETTIDPAIEEEPAPEEEPEPEAEPDETSTIEP